MNKYFLLMSILAVSSNGSVYGSNIEDNDVELHGGSIIKALTLNQTLRDKYSPEGLKCGDFQNFLLGESVQIDERNYEFLEGSIHYSGYSFTTPALTHTEKPEDVLPTSGLHKDLTLTHFIVDLDNSSFDITYEYQGHAVTYSNYSYEISVRTPIDQKDLDDVQALLLLNKYLPDKTNRNAFNDFRKDGGEIVIEGRSFGFVNGRKIYADHILDLTDPEDVLPKKLWLNDLRDGHALTDAHVQIEDDSARLYITYQYVPSMYYRGKAKFFSFTVETEIEAQDKNQFDFANIINQKVSNIHMDLIEAENDRLIAPHDFADIFFSVNEARVSLLEKPYTFGGYITTIKRIENTFYPYKMWFEDAQITLKDSLETVEYLSQKLYSNLIRIQEILPSEEFVTLLRGINETRTNLKEDLLYREIEINEIHKQFSVWENRLDMLSSPMALQMRILPINIFQLGRENPTLNVLTDSIFKFKGFENLSLATWFL